MWMILAITTATGLVSFGLSSSYENHGNWHKGIAGFAFGVAGCIVATISMMVVNHQLILLLLAPMLLNVIMMSLSLGVLLMRIKHIEPRR